jgi:hypothetical protein
MLEKDQGSNPIGSIEKMRTNFPNAFASWHLKMPVGLKFNV